MVDINARRDHGPQKTLNAEDPFLNIIITHSKFISSPFICLFPTTIPIIYPSFVSLYRDGIVVTAVEIKACDMCHSVDKLVRF